MQQEKWWKTDKVKKELAQVELCQCKALMKGKWVVADSETRERCYLCQRCKKRVYPKPL